MKNIGRTVKRLSQFTILTLFSALILQFLLGDLSAFAQLAPTPPTFAPPPSALQIVVLLIVAILTGITVVLVLAALLIRFGVNPLRRVLERLFCFPRLVSFTAVQDRIVVHKIAGNCEFVFGRYPAQAGMTFTATVTLPRRNCSGRLQFVQDIIIHNKRQPNVRQNPTTNAECISSNGVRMLDRADPYHERPIAGVGPHVITTNDSPGVHLNPSEIMLRKDRFRMFLMWIPSGFWGRVGVRLPIAKLDWGWEGRAEATNPQDTECSEGNLNWKKINSAAIHTSGRPTIRYPVLAPLVQDLIRAGWKEC